MYKHRTIFDEEQLLDELPENMRLDITQRVVRNFIRTYGFFSSFKESVILPLSLSLRRTRIKNQLNTGGSVNKIHGSSNKIHVLRTKIRRVLFVFFKSNL